MLFYSILFGMLTFICYCSFVFPTPPGSEFDYFIVLRFNKLFFAEIQPLRFLTWDPLIRVMGVFNAKQARRRRKISEASAFGDIVIGGHLIARNTDGGGVDHEKGTRMVREHSSGLMEVCYVCRGEVRS